MAHSSALKTSGPRSIFDHRYEVSATVGRGRNSIVYEAQTLFDYPGLPAGEPVALKVLTGSAKHPETNVERMRREAAAMLASRHENVVRAYDYVISGELCYLVMELAEKRDLATIIDGQLRPLSFVEVLRYGQQLLRGLQAIHEAGIIHCDIKPENLLIADKDTLKIADFGVSFIPTETRSMNEVVGVGTFDYLAPEILSGGRYSAASDIYAVGVTLFKLFTLNLPFSGTALTEQIEQKMSGDRRHLKDFITGVPTHLEALVEKALRIAPTERYQSAKEFEEAIETCLEKGLAPTVEERESDDPTLILDRETLAAIHPVAATSRTPLKTAAVTAATVMLLWTVSIYVSGFGFAMDRSGVPSPTSASLQKRVNFSGVLYDLLGEDQHVTFFGSSTGKKDELLISTDIPGWTPEVIKASALKQGRVMLKNGGLFFSLRVSSPDADDTENSQQNRSQMGDAKIAAHGSYRDIGSGREGHWVIWR